MERVYNNQLDQNDSNHRYMSVDGIYKQMIELGWAGCEGTVLCAPL